MSHAQMCLLVIGGVSAIVAIIMYCMTIAMESTEAFVGLPVSVNLN